MYMCTEHRTEWEEQEEPDTLIYSNTKYPYVLEAPNIHSS